MNAKVSALMAAQNGLVSRWQALDTGMSDEAVARQVRTGQWVVVRRGVYAVTVLWETLDEFTERPRLRALAASLAMAAPHVLSHDSAALVHRLPILAARPELVHITRFGVLGGRTRHGVKHHQAPHTPDQIVERDGVLVLDIARTALDIVREHGRRHGLPACDSALRFGASRDELFAVLEAMSCWPHSQEMRWCIEHADGNAENPWESLSRMLVIELGLGAVETQFGLTDGRRRAWADLRVGRHLVEFDGLWKYRPGSRGGFAPEDDPDRALVDEKLRQDFLTGFKLGMSRVTAADLARGAWESTKARVLREALQTRELFGSDLTDLQPFLLPKLLPPASSPDGWLDVPPDVPPL